MRDMLYHPLHGLIGIDCGQGDIRMPVREHPEYFIREPLSHKLYIPEIKNDLPKLL